MSDSLPTIFAKHGSDEIVRHLQQHGASFLVVGGTAVAVHGCRDKSDVDDFDFLIDPSIENARKTIAALSAASIRVPFPPEALTRPSVQVPLKVLHYWAELLTPAEGVSFSELMERSVQVQISFFRVHVIGRTDLLAMKEIAVQRLAADVSKHERDLACLRSV